MFLFYFRKNAILSLELSIVMFILINVHFSGRKFQIVEHVTASVLAKITILVKNIERTVMQIT